jgi:hypothetical protein
VTCDVGSLAAGASATVKLIVSGTIAGTATSSVEVTSSILDTDVVNNTVNAAAMTIMNPPPPPLPPPSPPPGGGEGGSAFDYATALMLAGVLGMVLRARRRAVHRRG